MSDWADERAREIQPGESVLTFHMRRIVESAKQEERARLLAEVRRVIREISEKHDGADSWCFVEAKILSRLDKLA